MKLPINHSVKLMITIVKAENEIDQGNAMTAMKVHFDLKKSLFYYPIIDFYFLFRID